MIRDHDARAGLGYCREFSRIGVDSYSESRNDRSGHLYGGQVGAKPVVEIG